MPIVYRYLINELIKYFCIVMGVVVGIYIAVDFFEKIDNFLEADVSLLKAFIFFLFKTPFVIAQIIPVCVLLSVLISFCLMIKNNEIVALKSSGVSIYYLLWPVVGFGLLFTLILFIISEAIVPATMEKANRIWRFEVKKKRAVVSKKKNIWIKENRSISHIRYYDPVNKTLYGLSYNKFDKDFRLIRRIDAKKGIFKERGWVLFDIMEQRKIGEDSRVEFYEKKYENLNFLPEDLQRVMKKSEEMSFAQLYSYIKKIEAEGYDALIYRVDLYAKIAFPFVCVIMCLIGSGIALEGRIKEGIPVKIAIGIGVAFIYWIFYSFCVSLGYGQMLPPVIAVWTANIIFICIGFYLLINAQ